MVREISLQDSPGRDGKSHTVDIEVRYAETDAMGVVHHANYLVWFELARTGLCAKTGHDYPGVEAAGYRILVIGAELRYHRGARYGDRVEVEVWLDRLESRGLHFSYEVRRDGERLAAGTTSHLWVEAATGRVRRIPSPWRGAFAAVVRAGPASRARTPRPSVAAPADTLAGHASSPAAHRR